MPPIVLTVTAQGMRNAKFRPCYYDETCCNTWATLVRDIVTKLSHSRASNQGVRDSNQTVGSSHTLVIVEFGRWKQTHHYYGTVKNGNPGYAKCIYTTLSAVHV